MLGSLNVVSAAGTDSGDTALTVTPEAAEGNIYKYKVDDEVPAVDYDDDLYVSDSFEIDCKCKNSEGAAEAETEDNTDMDTDSDDEKSYLAGWNIK